MVRGVVLLWVVLVLVCTEASTRPVLAGLPAHNAPKSSNAPLDTSTGPDSTAQDNVPNACGRADESTVRSQLLALASRLHLFAGGDVDPAKHTNDMCNVDSAVRVMRTAANGDVDDKPNPLEFFRRHSSTSLVAGALIAQKAPGGELASNDNAEKSAHDQSVEADAQAMMSYLRNSQESFELAKFLIKAGSLETLLSGRLNKATIVLLVDDVDEAVVDDLLTAVGDGHTVLVQNLRAWRRTIFARHAKPGVDEAAKAIVEGKAGLLTDKFREDFRKMLHGVLMERYHWSDEFAWAAIRMVSRQTLSRADFRTLVPSLGDAELDLVFSATDSDHSGDLSYEERLRLLSEPGPSVGKSFEDDTDAEALEAPDEDGDLDEARALVKEQLEGAHKTVSEALNAAATQQGMEQIHKLYNDRTRKLGALGDRLKRRALSLKKKLPIARNSLADTQGLTMWVFKAAVRVFVILFTAAVFFGVLLASQGLALDWDGLAVVLGFTNALSIVQPDSPSPAPQGLLQLGLDAVSGLPGLVAHAGQSLMQLGQNSATNGTWEAMSDQGRAVSGTERVIVWSGIAFYCITTHIQRYMWAYHGMRVLTSYSVLTASQEPWYLRSDFYGLLPLLVSFVVAMVAASRFFKSQASAAQVSVGILTLVGMNTVFKAWVKQVLGSYGNSMLGHKDAIDGFELKHARQGNRISDELFARMLVESLALQAQAHGQRISIPKCQSYFLPIVSSFLAVPSNAEVAHNTLGTLTVTGMCQNAYMDARMEYVVHEIDLLNDVLMKLVMVFQQSSKSSASLRLLDAIVVHTDLSNAPLPNFNDDLVTYPIVLSPLETKLGLGPVCRIATCKIRVDSSLLSAPIETGDREPVSLDVPVAVTRATVTLDVVTERVGKAKYVLEVERAA